MHDTKSLELPHIKDDQSFDKDIFKFCYKMKEMDLKGKRKVVINLSYIMSRKAS